MNIGWIVNPERKNAFLKALLGKLAGPDTLAAFWFYQPVPLPVTAESLKGPSPFPGSGSSLGGSGYLVRLSKDDVLRLIAFFDKDQAALDALIHLEVERERILQFRSYDSFSVNIMGPALDSNWLTDLAAQGIISFDR